MYDSDKELTQAEAFQRRFAYDQISVDQALQGKELQDAKLKYQQIPIPENLDRAIWTGIVKGKKAEKTSFTRKLSLLAACFLLISFITSVRVSPAFAAYVSRLPGLEQIVKLITYDKGLQAALDNDFMQPVGLSDEHEGILFEVDGIIVDESSMVLFYTLENKNWNDEQSPLVNIGKFEFLDEYGERLKEFSYSIDYPQQNEIKNGSFHEKVSLYFSEGETLLPDKLTVRAYLRDVSPSFDKPIRAGEEREQHEEELLPSVWEVVVPLDKARFADLKKTYSLNETLDVQGQKVTFKKVTVYPTRIALEVEYDPNNTAKIFGFDDLKFVNENGEEWARIVNGITGTKPSETSEILYFQSNFFTDPKKLYLEGSSIRLLPKEDTEVLVDLEHKKILKGPAGLELKEVEPANSGSIRVATFSLKVDPQDENRGFSVFPFNFKDASGNNYNMKSQGNVGPLTSGSAFKQELRLELPDEKYQYPLIFLIDDYPNRVKKEFQFKVK